MTNSLALYLVKNGVLRSPDLIRAFERARRSDFLPEDLRSEAGRDEPLPIGFGQTISQPYTVAFMLELLGVAAGQKILDAGSGSGWQTALLAAALEKRGEVWALEIIPELHETGRRNLAKYGFRNVHCVLGSGRGDFPGPEYFDRIIVAAASPDMPSSLVARLGEGGRMVLPLGRGYCDIVVLEKNNGMLTELERHPGFVFVPLV